jgi:S-adenosylmethionine synthetase
VYNVSVQGTRRSHSLSLILSSLARVRPRSQTAAQERPWVVEKRAIEQQAKETAAAAATAAAEAATAEAFETAEGATSSAAAAGASTSAMATSTIGDIPPSSIVSSNAIFNRTGSYQKSGTISVLRCNFARQVPLQYYTGVPPAFKEMMFTLFDCPSNWWDTI